MIDKFFTFKGHPSHMTMSKLLKSEIAYVGGVVPPGCLSNSAYQYEFSIELKNSSNVVIASYDTEEEASSAHTALMEDLDIINNNNGECVFDAVRIIKQAIRNIG